MVSKKIKQLESFEKQRIYLAFSVKIEREKTGVRRNRQKEERFQKEPILRMSKIEREQGESERVELT